MPSGRWAVLVHRRGPRMRWHLGGPAFAYLKKIGKLPADAEYKPAA